MELQDFIHRVTILEQKADPVAEREFWSARERLGNYLAHPLDMNRLLDSAVPFLKRWNSYRRCISWSQLVELWAEDKQHVARQLEKECLEKAEYSALAKAAKLYSYLCQVRGIGHTNASKLLALSLPELCVMWDTSIRKEFSRSRPPPAPGLKAWRRNLYCDFLCEQQKFSEKLIKECMQMRGIGRADAIKWLRELPKRVPNAIWPEEKPLAKLLDEYNYQRTRPWDC